jgi:hypothetical protein
MYENIPDCEILEVSSSKFENWSRIYNVKMLINVINVYLIK